MANTTEKPKESLTLSVGALRAQATQLWKRIEPHISFVVAVSLLSGIIAAIIIVGQTVHPTDGAPLSTTTNSPYSTNFDTTTINRVLTNDQRAKNNTTITLPGGRINPFAE